MARRTISISAAVAALVAVASSLLLGGAVHAIPDGGASPDTKGTAAEVWPRTVKPGDILNFKVTGFPVGETVFIKVDDGQSCSTAAVHGACVIHQQRVPQGGAVQGSFRVPADLGNGKHWLRFLASAVKYGPDGERLGVDPFTLRGNSDFTVVAATGSTPSTQSPTAPAQAPGAPGNTSTQGPSNAPVAPADGVDGGASPDVPTGTVAAGEVLVVDLSASSPSEQGATDGGATPSAPDVDAQSPSDASVAAAPADRDTAAFPLVGVLALAIGLLASALLLRRPAARG